MVSILNCLNDGIFAKSTIKPLSSIFGLDNEISRVKAYLTNGEWFLISGLRRTGKTTLVRSVAATLKEYSVFYLNSWKILPEHARLEQFIDIMGQQLQDAAKSFWGRVKITDMKVWGISIKFDEKKKIFDQLLDQLTQEKKLIWIIDEVQDFFKDGRLFRYLGALHDQYAPQLTVVLLGSVVGLRKVLKLSASHPLYGRISEEILLMPFDQMTSRLFLKKGFEQCKMEIEEEIINEATLQLGGFAGWLSHFGRLCVIENKTLHLNSLQNFKKLLQRLEMEAQSQIINEIGRMLYDKRKQNVYLTLLKKIAEESISSISELSKQIKRSPSTTIEYLSYLQSHGIIKKMENGYIIADPLTRRILRTPGIETEIKKRI